MTTALRGSENRSQRQVFVANPEQNKDNTVIPAGTNSETKDTLYAWIPQQEKDALKIQTGTKTFFVWDEDWSIKVKKEVDGEGYALMKNIKDAKDYKLIILESGDIQVEGPLK